MAEVIHLTKLTGGPASRSSDDTEGFTGNKSLIFSALAGNAAAAGNTPSFDTEFLPNVSWIADVTALAGGVPAHVVTVIWEHSFDGTTYYALATEADLTAVGFKQRLVRESVMRFVRVRWTIGAGDQTSGTIDVYIQAKP